MKTKGHLGLVKINNIIFLGLFLVCLPWNAFSQEKNSLDSLERLYANAESDVKKADILGFIFNKLYTNPDIFTKYQRKYYHIARDEKNARLLATTYHHAGVFCYYQSNLKSAKLYLDSAVNLSRYKKNEALLMSHLMTRGGVHYALFDFQAALKDYIECEKYMIKFKSPKIGGLYGNITMIFTEINDFDQAEKYSKKAMEFINPNDFESLIKSYNNIGLIYKRKGDFDAADSVFRKGLKMVQGEDFLRDKSDLLYNLAEVLMIKKKYKEALDLSYELERVMNKHTEQNWMKMLYMNIAMLNQKVGKNDVALNYLAKAESIQWSDEAGTSMDMDYYHTAGHLYLELKNYQKAAINYRKAYDLSLKDKKEGTLINIQKLRFQNEREKDSLTFAKQKEIDDLYNQKLQKEAEHKLNRQRIIIAVAIIGFLLISVFSGFLYRAIRQKEQANKELSQQKILVFRKNEEITDSINYAKRIQHSLLPPLQIIQELLPNHFLLYMPKDIVSGDFYWLKKINENEYYVAVADCTGHGVPGAIMSALAIQQLNEISTHETSVNKILEQLNNKLKLTLQQDEAGNSKDGLDICLCKINRKNNTVSYSGANRNLWILKNTGGFTEIKATKTGIAGHTQSNQLFEKHEITPEINDFFVLSSDGFADQFGGPKQKKITTKKFKQILSEWQARPLKEIGNSLKEYFLSWKQNSEQIDDVCVLGFKIT